MLEQRARVVAVDQDGLWVEAHRRHACQHCSSRNSCGQPRADGPIARLHVAATVLPMPAPGSTVSLLVPDAFVLKLSLLFYLLPLAALLAGSLFAASLGGGEAAALLGGGAGLAGGILVARHCARRLETRPDFRPRIQEEAAASPGSSLTQETES